MGTKKEYFESVHFREWKKKERKKSTKKTVFYDLETMDRKLLLSKFSHNTYFDLIFI